MYCFVTNKSATVRKTARGQREVADRFVLTLQGALGDLAQNSTTRAFALKRKNHQTTNGRNLKEQKTLSKSLRK